MIVAPPVLRIALAVPFFRSGDALGRLSFALAERGLSVRGGVQAHIFGGEYGFPAPIVIAHIGGTEPAFTVAGVP